MKFKPLTTWLKEYLPEPHLSRALQNFQKSGRSDAGATNPQTALLLAFSWTAAPENQISKEFWSFVYDWLAKKYSGVTDPSTLPPLPDIHDQQPSDQNLPQMEHKPFSTLLKEYLPEPYSSVALINLKKFGRADSMATTPQIALELAFPWSETLEYQVNNEFWPLVRDYLEKKHELSKNLPTLPYPPIIHDLPETEVESKVYRLLTEDGLWLGDVVLTTNGMFAAVTDYGNFSFSWSAYGKQSFRQFLISLNTDYFGTKMAQGMAYVASSKSMKIACKKFAEKILPPLQKVLRDEIESEKQNYDHFLKTILKEE